MKKLFWSVILLLFAVSVKAQSVTSLQLNGGILLPNHAHNGMSLQLQVNHDVSQSITLYAYAGYSVWNRNKVIIQENMKNYAGYTEDEHSLFPIYIGGKWNFNFVKTFTTFVGAEIGYNYLSYNEYGEVDFIEDPGTTFYPVNSSKKEINQSMFGFGISLGINQTIAEIYGLSVIWKMNNIFRSIDDPQTIYSVNAGFSINI